MYRCSILVKLFVVTLTINVFVCAKTKYQLHDRTVWAAGRPARFSMKRHKEVPLVTWSEEAVAVLTHHWETVQHGATCERVLWMKTFFYGLTSQIRDWLDFAIVSVFTHNRTIIEIYRNEWYESWCPDGNWLTCFFEPFHGTQCNGYRPGEDVKEVLSITEFGGKTRHITTVTHAQYIRNTLTFHNEFPNVMWDKLVAANLIIYRNSDTMDPMDHAATQELKRNNALLYYTVSLSALKSMIVKHVLVPKKYIRRKATELTQYIKKSKPVIAVHMRRTDQHADNGVNNHIKFTDGFVTKAIHMLCKQHFFVFRLDASKGRSDCLDRLRSGITVLALSDDATAIMDLKRHLGPKFSVHTLSNVSTLLHTDPERDQYNELGHRVDFFRVSSPRAHNYHASVFVDVVAASQADMLIGSGSSGVSQFIAQIIGARNRVDGNALTLWQEDLEASPLHSKARTGIDWLWLGVSVWRWW